MIKTIIFKSLVLIIFVISIYIPRSLYAQQYGPRSFAIAPEGLNVFSRFYRYNPVQRC
jgi:hypothetical protein